MSSDFERLGGEPVLRAIIEDFTRRVFDDVMIGFLFDGKPKARITEMEYRHAAAHLGGPVEYTGRSMRAAHRASPILGGHFRRRRQILVNTLRDHQVPQDIAERWIAHQDALMDEVLGEGVSEAECDHDAQAARGADGGR